MSIIVCRVAWMPAYRSEQEPAYGGGAHITDEGIPYEAYNFLPIDGTYYGYVAVPRGGKQDREHGRMNINRLGATAADETIAGVTVVFCASDPKTKEFLVTGWYNNAIAYREGIDRPGDSLRQHCINFTSNEAVLVQESERTFRMPKARDVPREDFGGVGEGNIWYGLNRSAAQEYLELLENYMAHRFDNQNPGNAAYEEKQRRLSKTLERRGSYRRFIHQKGFACEACGWSIEDCEQNVWGSSFELHHLIPFSELDERQHRLVRPEDFAVLCASCHRAIHRTPFVSDVPRFVKEHLGVLKGRR